MASIVWHWPWFSQSFDLFMVYLVCIILNKFSIFDKPSCKASLFKGFSLLNAVPHRHHKSIDWCLYIYMLLFLLFQVLSPCTDEDAHLHVPPLEKQFLISPPCSPPVGWEQPREDKPVVDYDLLAAMAQLSPGRSLMLRREACKYLARCILVTNLVSCQRALMQIHLWRHSALDTFLNMNEIESHSIWKIPNPSASLFSITLAFTSAATYF